MNHQTFDTLRRAAMAAVSAVILAGAAAAAGSPACALLGSDQAAAALKAPPKVDDGGPARKGYSDCAWLGPGGRAVVSVLYWNDPEKSANRYNDIVAALKRRRQAAKAVPDLGEAGIIFDESAAGLMAFTIVTRSGSNVLQIIARGVTRTAALGAARSMVANLPTDLRPGDAPPTEAAEATPGEDGAPAIEATPETVPETAPAETPGTPGAPPDETTPTETAPPAPVAETPPEPAPAEPAPADAQPAPPEPAPPEPAVTEPPKPKAPRKTAATTGSPACKLLKASDFSGTFSVIDGGPERDGESNCTWQAISGTVSVSANLLRGMAIIGAAEDASTYFDIMQDGASAAEPLDGVGERAYLEKTGTDESPAFSISILAGRAVILLNALRVDRATAVGLARKAAGNL